MTWRGTRSVEHSRNSHAIQTYLITCFIQFIRTQVGVYVLAAWRFRPRLTCTSSPFENLDRSWSVRPRRLRILTEVDVYVFAVWEFRPKLKCTSSPIENFDRSWRVRPRRLRILTEVGVYVLADWEFWPTLTCTSSPFENLDRSWRVRPRRVRTLTEVTLHSSSDRESVSCPHFSKITHPWTMFRDSLEHPPRYCLRRRLGSKNYCHWLSLTLQVSNA
jgi:hypothetical protein